MTIDLMRGRGAGFLIVYIFKDRESKVAADSANVNVGKFQQGLSKIKGLRDVRPIPLFGIQQDAFKLTSNCKEFSYEIEKTVNGVDTSDIISTDTDNKSIATISLFCEDKTHFLAQTTLLFLQKLRPIRGVVRVDYVSADGNDIAWNFEPYNFEYNSLAGTTRKDYLLVLMRSNKVSATRRDFATRSGGTT